MREQRDARLPRPWNAFLSAVDNHLSGPTELHCLGGFVLHAVYGSSRPTSDLDHIAVIPGARAEELRLLAGRDSSLAKQHKIWIEYVTIAEVPENYDERIEEIFSRAFKNLRLLALEAYDLVLSKLTRGSPVDREDAKFLIVHKKLDANVLCKRYRQELRPRFAEAKARWHDQTLELWIEAACS